MPRAVSCLGCGRPTPHAVKGRCPECRRELDRNDFYQSPEWRRIARAAKADPDAACTICGSTKRLIAHHSHARREGGPDTKENIVLLCGEGAIGCDWQSCHSQYEADKRTGRDTELRRLVEAL